VAKAIQAAGPLHLADLPEFHGIDLRCDSENELFLIDCEGLRSCEDTCPCLVKAIFALVQISSLTVVFKDQLSYQTLDSFRSLFALSRAFSQEVSGFIRGTVIIETGVGVRGASSLEGWETERRRADEGWSERYRKLFSQKDLHFSPDELRVICQPAHDEGNLYLNSMCDLMSYAYEIQGRRNTFSVMNLLDLFAAVKTRLMPVNDFENLVLPFEGILRDLVERYLCEAMHFARGFFSELAELIRRLPVEDLRRYPDLPLIAEGKIRIQGLFQDKAMELLCHILEYDPGLTRRYLEQLNQFIDESSREQIEITYVDMIKQKAKDLYEEFSDEVRTEIRNISDEMLPKLGSLTTTLLVSPQIFGEGLESAYGLKQSRSIHSFLIVLILRIVWARCKFVLGDW
jgi:hypothetical protein